MKIKHLLTILQGVGYKPVAEDIADCLWLAAHMGPLKEALTRGVSRERSSTGGGGIDQKTGPVSLSEATKASSEDESLSSSRPVYPKVGRGLAIGGRRGSLNRNPDTPLDMGGLEASKALRALKRRIESSHVQVMDEAATADRIAEWETASLSPRRGCWLPVLKPAQERWLSLALVIDVNPSMDMVSREVKALERHFRMLGAFREVRTWSLDTSSFESPSLSRAPGGPRRHSGELVSADGRCLTVVVTDCLGTAWYGRALKELLERWARHQPTGVLLALPESLRRRSGLSNASFNLVRSPRPGASNHALRRNDRSEELPEDQKVRSIPLPVIAMIPKALEAWTRFLTDSGQSQVRAACLHPLSQEPVELWASVLGIGRAIEEMAPEERLRAFKRHASTGAIRLTQLLSKVFPSTLPVARLVQRVLLPRTGEREFAEAIQGGLVRQAQMEETATPETVLYEFYPGLEELLGEALDRADIHHMEQLIRRFVLKSHGSASSFPGVVPDKDGLVTIPGARSFLTIPEENETDAYGPPVGALAKNIERNRPLLSAVDYANKLLEESKKLRSDGHLEQALETSNAIIRRYGARKESEVQEPVAKALVNKGWTLGSLGRSEEEMDVYDEVVRRFSEREEEVALLEPVAQALVNKGWRLGSLGRSEDALSVYDEVVRRFSEREEVALLEPVAQALVNKGGTLGSLGHSEEQLDALAQAEGALRQQSQKSGEDLHQNYNYACLLALRGQEEEALQALQSCLEAGTISIDHVREDTDWDAFRSSFKFKELLSL